MQKYEFSQEIKFFDYKMEVDKINGKVVLNKTEIKLEDIGAIIAMLRAAKKQFKK